MSDPESRGKVRGVSGIHVYPGAFALHDLPVAQPLHLALGMFDGVHRGHAEVIRQAVDETRAEPEDLSGVLTFDPHPSRILYPERATSLIMPLEERIERMRALGIDHVFVQPFTLAYAQREAEAFVPLLKEEFPGLKSLHVGCNFRFGRKRGGDVTLLRETGSALGISVHVREREVDAGEPVSSSRIRTALAEGRIEEANRLLGHPYRVSGTVVPGRKIGRGIGFPTINIPWSPETLPCFGVYQVAARVAGSSRVQTGIANYGIRPTFETGGRPLLEVHLLDGGGGPTPTSGEPVEVLLLRFIRKERNFPSKEALQAQIGRDVGAVSKIPLPEPGNF